MANLRNLVDKFKQNFTDNQGWFRGGKFTPQQQVQDFKTDLPANLAYGQAKVAQAFAPKWQVPTNDQLNNPTNQLIGQKTMDLFSPTKSMSAQVNQYPVVQQTPQNQQLEQQKQTILNSGAFRPAMARYLSTVPVNYESGLGKGAGITDTTAGQTYGKDTSGNQSWEKYQGSYQPVIAMGDTDNTSTMSPSKQENLSPVLAHELVHAAPRNMQYKEQFQKLYEGMTPESNPVLFNSAATYLRFNNQKPPNAEELYATLAQNMGTNVLNIPEVRKFYENLFSQ